MANDVQEKRTRDHSTLFSRRIREALEDMEACSSDALANLSPDDRRRYIDADVPHMEDLQILDDPQNNEEFSSKLAVPTDAAAQWPLAASPVPHEGISIHHGNMSAHNLCDRWVHIALRGCACDSDLLDAKIRFAKPDHAQNMDLYAK